MTRGLPALTLSSSSSAGIFTHEYRKKCREDVVKAHADFRAYHGQAGSYRFVRRISTDKRARL